VTTLKTLNPNSPKSEAVSRFPKAAKKRQTSQKHGIVGEWEGVNPLPVGAIQLLAGDNLTLQFDEKR